MLDETRESLRRMGRRPGSYLLGAVTMSVGIAVALVMFTLVDSVLLRPFPFKNQDRLVTLWAGDPQRGVARLEIAWYELERCRTEAKSFSDYAAFSAANSGVVVKRRGEPVQLHANIVSRSFLTMLGVQAARGRIFTEAEHQPNGPPVAMLSYGAWVRLFGSDPSIVGEALEAGGQPIEIVGILPPYLDLPDDADIISPLESAIPDENSRNARVLTGLALLREGATLEQARAEIATIASRIEQDRPEANKGITLSAFPLVSELLGVTRPALKLLLAMGIALLLIAFSNVVNVFLTRAVGREREMSLRAALGATRGRLLRQMSLEALIVTAGASAAGLALAYWGIALVRRLAPADLPRLGEVGIRSSSYLLLVGIAAGASVTLAWLSTWRHGRIEAFGALGASNRVSLPRGTRALLNGVVVSQIALTLLLLAAASSFLRAFIDLVRVDVGFRTEHVITAQVPRGYTFQNDPKRRLYFDQLFERVQALPAVEAAGSVLMRPLEMEQGWDFAYTLQGQGPAEQEANPMGNLLSASPGYFDAMGIAFRGGRTFERTDTLENERVAVISESFAKRLGGVDRALGRQLKSGKPDSKAPWMKVVGVVSDVRYRALVTEKLDIYVPYTQSNWSPNYLAVRTAGEPEAIIGPLRAIARELDPDTPISSVRTTAQLVGAKLAQPRLNAMTVATLAGIALFLAFIGLYGLQSYVTSLRTQELGVRVCLGATPGSLRWMVIREALGIAAAGVAIGAAASLVLAKLMSSVSYGIGSIDAGVLVGAAVVLVAVCAGAALVPAMRATSVEPAIVLRND